jgi:xylan 1,4-beta-xylosidase
MSRLLRFQLALLGLTLSVPLQVHAQEVVPIDAHAQTTPFPHFWEQMFGSGRANLT